MRYNPCGRIVDFGRKPYRCECRFLRDDGRVGTVRWVEADPDAPTLDKVCIISRREWERDEWLPAPVGEVTGAQKKFSPSFVPVGLPGEHVCGTDEDFDLGGKYEPELPPMEYAANGWPRCCTPPLLVRGGAVGSGLAFFAVVRGLARPSGGKGGGKSLIDNRRGLARPSGGRGGGFTFLEPVAPIHTYGGGYGGGSQIHMNTSICPEYGNGCGDATEEAFGAACEITIWPRRLPAWRVWIVEPGTTYRFTVWTEPGSSWSWKLYDGLNCIDKVQIAEGTVEPPFIFEFILVAEFTHFWWNIDGDGPILGYVHGAANLIEL